MNRRFCRRSGLLIFIVLLVFLALLLYQWSRLPAPAEVKFNLAEVAPKVGQFLRESKRKVKEQIVEVLQPKNLGSLAFHEYFTEADNDGTKLYWIHQTEFHIPWKNENESVCMVDINSLMNETGQVNLKALATITSEGKHGLHLSVSSLDQATVAMTYLSKLRIKSPVLISANVLTGPNVMRCRRDKRCPYQEPVHVDSLIPRLKSELRAQVGLGWTNFFDPSTTNRGYTWPMTVSMFELTREVRQRNLSLVLMIRAPLARSSLTQLNWLTEVSDTSMVVETTSDDGKLKYLPDDIALLYNIIPKSRLFLRMPKRLRDLSLNKFKDFTMPDDWKTFFEHSAYVDQDWKVMHEYDKKYFLRSRNAVLMYPCGTRPVYMGSIFELTLLRRVATVITGRVTFFEHQENIQMGKFNSGLKIFVDTEFEHISERGNQILIGSSGYVSISSYSTRRDLIMSDRKLVSINPCYQFTIEAETRGFDVTLSSPIDCNYPLAQKSKELLKVRLDVSLSKKPFKIFVQAVGKEPVLIDQFRTSK